MAPAWSCRRKSIAADVLAWLPPSSSRPQFSGVNAGRQMGMYLHGPGHTHLTRVPALRTAPWPASTTVTPPACSRRTVPSSTSTYSSKAGHWGASDVARRTSQTQAEKADVLDATLPTYSVMVRSGASTTATGWMTRTAAMIFSISAASLSVLHQRSQCVCNQSAMSVQSSAPSARQ